ncbi:MAG: hypothetical protein K0V04_17220 [Deltaproteobacteria bacterium]|nr:hypothetical protein [Deltaproteobacteria bacterium]
MALSRWCERRDHGGRIFVDLRDREGITQIVFGPDIHGPTHAEADGLRSKYCIAIAGKVIDRGDNENPNLDTEGRKFGSFFRGGPL